jgi:hypothetical protein
LPGRLQKRYVARNRNGGPVNCNFWFGNSILALEATRLDLGVWIALIEQCRIAKSVLMESKHF